MLEWQKAHGLSTNKENSASLAIKCESPTSPNQMRARRLKRHYPTEDDCSKPKIFLETNETYTKFGDEENDNIAYRRYPRNLVTKTDYYFGKEQLRVLRSHYYFSSRMRPLPLRNLPGDRNGNNLLMIAPAQNNKGDEDEVERVKTDILDRRNDGKNAEK